VATIIEFDAARRGVERLEEAIADSDLARSRQCIEQRGLPRVRVPDQRGRRQA